MGSMIPAQSMAPPPSIDNSLPPLKLNSSTGRHIRVDPERRMDVGRAFRSLEIMCARNKVKRDFMRQRYHERPGMKRKRLKSERWRQNFKASFKETVKLVMKMKRQGW
jgi:small subunit ribosomal protein MRP21